MVAHISPGLLHVNSLWRIATDSVGLNTQHMRTIDEIRRENLARLILAAGSQSALAGMTGKAPAQISQWLNASLNSRTGKPRVMSTAIARELEQSCAKPSGWMDADHSESLDNVRVGNLGNVEPGPASRGDVPLISWVAASDWCEAGDPYPPGVAEEWLPCPARHSKGTFALRVRGDSMTAPHGNTRTYPEGSVIFVDPERRSPENGDRIIACLEGAHEVTFKVYKNEDGRQWLAPLNPSHEPIRDPFRVLGTIIGKWEAE